jgi:hypothetical protein
MTGGQVRPSQVDVALSDLVGRGVLTPVQAAEVRSALNGVHADRGPTRWWAELAGYLGGVLLLGGGALLVANEWDRLGDALRGALLALVALTLFGAGLVIGRGPRGPRRLGGGSAPTRRRVIGVLFALASGAAAGSAAVIGDEHAGPAAGAVGLLVAGAGYVLLRTAPGLLASAVASMVLVLSTAAELDASTPFAFGLAFLGLGAVWVTLAVVGLATPRPLGLAVGMVLAVAGAQQPLGQAGAEGWAYLMTFGVALASFVLYLWRRDVVLLVGGVIGVAVVAPEAVWDWTDGAAGGAVILLVAGAALVAASAVGLGLWRAHPTGRGAPSA